MLEPGLARVMTGLGYLLGVILEKEFSHRNKTEIFTNFVAQIPYYKNKNYQKKTIARQ